MDERGKLPRHKLTGREAQMMVRLAQMDEEAGRIPDFEENLKIVREVIEEQDAEAAGQP